MTVAHKSSPHRTKPCGALSVGRVAEHGRAAVPRLGPLRHPRPRAAHHALQVIHAVTLTTRMLCSLQMCSCCMCKQGVTLPLCCPSRRMFFTQAGNHVRTHRLVVSILTAPPFGRLERKSWQIFDHPCQTCVWCAAGARKTTGSPTRSRCRTSRPSSAASRLEMFNSARTLAAGDPSELA